MMSRRGFHNSCKRASKADQIAAGCALFGSLFVIAIIFCYTMFLWGRELVRVIF